MKKQLAIIGIAVLLSATGATIYNSNSAKY